MATGPGRIVVGFDGSDHSRRALDWAIHEARLRDVRLVVVHAFDFGIAAADPTAARALDVMAREAQTTLDRAVHYAREHGVDVEGRLEYGSAAKALVDAGDGADLLVVGSRGRGGLAGALLGSVSSACVRHAACPILVVPPPDRLAQARATPKEDPEPGLLV